MFSNEEEYKTYKEKIRQQALDKELKRQKDRASNARKVTRILWGVIVALFLVISFLFVKMQKPQVNKSTIPVTDTLFYTDTFYVYYQPKLSAFYTVQVGAFNKLKLPKLLENDDFPLVQFSCADSLQCVGFGRYVTLEEAEKGMLFLRQIGIDHVMIVWVVDGEREKIVL